MNHPAPTLTHDWIWQAIDALASRKGLSPSALARLAGLDATAFNRSKRFTLEGRPRWPSTESIAKILEVTGTPLDEFADIANRTAEAAPFAHASLDDIPCLGEIRSATVIDTGTGNRVNLDQTFALIVADTSLEPVYSQGNTLIVSRAEPLRPGDRVVVKPTGMQPLPRLLMRESVKRIELAQFQPEQRRIRLQRHAIDWIARIIWVRQ